MNSKSLKNMELKISEKKLVGLCQSGDTEAFEKLIEINGGKMKNWAASLCKKEDRDLIDEIYQMTLIKCWTKISTFKGNSSFSTWANTISRNIFYDLKRISARRTFISTDVRRCDRGATLGQSSYDLVNDFFVSDTNQPVFGSLKLEDPDGNTVSLAPYQKIVEEERREENKKTASKMLGKLSPKHKEVLKLYEYKRLSYKEIAKKVGISEGTVMSRIFNARKNIKRMLAGK